MRQGQLWRFYLSPKTTVHDNSIVALGASTVAGSYNFFPTNIRQSIRYALMPWYGVVIPYEIILPGPFNTSPARTIIGNYFSATTCCTNTGRDTPSVSSFIPLTYTPPIVIVLAVAL